MAARTILSRNGYSIDKAQFDGQTIQKLRSELSIVPHVERPEFGGGAQEPITLFRETAKRLYMPRYFGLKQLGLPEINKVHIKKGTFTPNQGLGFAGYLRQYQQTPLQNTLAKIESSGGGIIAVYCGWGKTVALLWLLSELARKGLIRKAMVVVHTSTLMVQWRERIQTFLPQAKIGILQQNKAETTGNDIIIASLKSLAVRHYDPTLFDQIDVVAFDEIHVMCTRLFSNAFLQVAAPFTIGLSATPSRTDKCEVIFEHFVGPVLYAAARPPKPELRVLRLPGLPKSKVIIVRNEKSNRGRSDISYVRTVTTTCFNMERNLSICRVMADILQTPDRKILVLSEYIRHLKMLRGLLVGEQFGLLDVNDDETPTTLLKNPDAKTCGLYIGSCTQPQRLRSQQADVVLGTYKLAAVGMDIPSLNVLVMASPRKDIEQSVGRILRSGKGPDVIHPLIIDVVDDHGLFWGQYRKRKQFYRSNGYSLGVYAADGSSNAGDDDEKDGEEQPQDDNNEPMFL